MVNLSGVDINTLKHANTSAKRRKLDTDGHSTSIQSSRLSLPAPRKDIYALEEDGQPEPAVSEITNGSIERPIIIQQSLQTQQSPSVPYQRAGRSPSPLVEEDEITESPPNAPGSGHRTRKIGRAAVQTSSVQGELKDENGRRPASTGSATSRRKRKRTTSDPPNTVQSRRGSNEEASNEVQESADAIDELSPGKPKLRRRRRSSIQSEVSVDGDEHTTDENEIAEEIEDTEAAIILRKNRRLRISRRAQAEASPDLDEPSEELLPAPETQHSQILQKSSPVKQRNPKNGNRKEKPSKKQAKKHIRTGSPIPVTVQRLTKRTIYDDHEPDADILNADIPYSKRGGVNVIDVLNSLCTEIADSALETLEHSSRNTEDPALKREYKNKLKVIEHFVRELQSLLLEHVSICSFVLQLDLNMLQTINLDNAAALEKRLRDERKKKLALREKILKVRAERQKVALRMDEIRIQHERESRDAQVDDPHNL